MGYKVIAPVGDNLKALFIGMKEFPTESVFLITPQNKLKEADELSKKLEEFTIGSNIIKINGNIMEEMFRSFGKICATHDEDELIVNVATGDRMSTCAALSAAFANGLKAFGIIDNKPILLPIMKLSYYRELSDNKLKILNELDSEKYISLKELSDKTKMSVSLASYHINGNYKHKGLKEFRLVDIKDENKNLCIKLSDMGRLLLKGYIKTK
ncbi:winged helix-turn-helix transcriptional regulator [Candidatus Woesearchaeota archaeon]|nr:winged helix-turn-helix transcriptional regulator [Candidatus Woesearchaeota archaeon]